MSIGIAAEMLAEEPIDPLDTYGDAAMKVAYRLLERLHAIDLALEDLNRRMIIVENDEHLRRDASPLA
jgi:hypothetical protein